MAGTRFPDPQGSQTNSLLDLCKQTMHRSVVMKGISGRSGSVINRHQCELLFNRIQGAGGILDSIQLRHVIEHGSKINAVLGELLETLLLAGKLIEASNVSDCYRAAMEQGDMKETFLKLLYEVKWCTNILLSILVDDNSAKFCNAFGPDDCDGKLGKEDEYHRLLAVERDEGKGLADQLPEQVQASPADVKVLFLKPECFNKSPYGHSVLGSGAFGTVHRGTYLGQGLCAIKAIEAWHPTVKDSIQKELDVIKVLGHHPHLVRFFCYSQDDESFYLIMELMDMDLAKVVINKDPKLPIVKLPIVKAVSLMLQIAEGVKYIHNKGVAHRDLKLENVLVKYDRFHQIGSTLPKICSVKIADFGLSKTRETSKTYSNQTLNTGTSWYMAPEVMKIGDDDPHEAKFNPRKADVYSFAIMCAVILNGKGPYDDCIELGNRKIIKTEVKEGKRRPALPADCPRRLDILIRKCWAGIPSKRPLFDVICRELRYIKGLLLREDEETLASVGFEALELDGVETAKVEGPWGSEDGIKFMDMATSIRGIKLNFSTGEYALVGQVEVTYEHFGISFTRTYGDGRNGKLEKEIVFDQCEFITCISGVTGQLPVSLWRKWSTISGVKSLTIHTNLTSYGPFGEKNSEKDTPFTSSTGTVIGFHGATAGGYVHSLGVVIIPDAAS